MVTTSSADQRQTVPMRIYMPATLDDLNTVAHSDHSARWTVHPRQAHAVTEHLRAALPDEDEEGLEYVAALNAADDCLALLAGQPEAPPQRVIITVEVPDTTVSPTSSSEDEQAPSHVTLTDIVEDVAIICVHVDEVEAAADITQLLTMADQENNSGARPEVVEESETELYEALQRVTDRSLLWYDWSEIQAIPRA